jgi:hypothetical protein
MFSTAYENGTVNRGTVSEFTTERQYLKNVTPKTLAWYADAFKAFEGALESEAAIKRRIVELRTRGVQSAHPQAFLCGLLPEERWESLLLVQDPRAFHRQDH